MHISRSAVLNVLLFLAAGMTPDSRQVLPIVQSVETTRESSLPERGAFSDVL